MSYSYADIDGNNLNGSLLLFQRCRFNFKLMPCPFLFYSRVLSDLLLNPKCLPIIVSFRSHSPVSRNSHLLNLLPDFG